MKILTIIITVLALGLIGFNATQLNFDALFDGKSMVAVITILAALCAILMMAILWVSKRIETKVKGRK